LTEVAFDRVKYLSILRHGKAAEGEDWPIDLDRPLVKRGRKDLANIVKVLQQTKPAVDWIITSPARRARQSAELVAQGLQLDKSLVVEDAIYEHGADALMTLLEHVPPDIQHALLVGHNPTLERLISGLCAGSQTRMQNKLPTAGLATMELQIVQWEQARQGCGSLLLYMRPKQLRAF